jgi:hypothetical protein
MEKVLEGDLTRFSVPDVLTLLHMGQRTGVLALERNAEASPYEETKLFVREGRPVFATASRDDLRLGALLVKMDRVKEADLDRMVGRRHGAQRLGEILLEEKILTEVELASFLKVQVSEVIFDTFVWRSGVFTFYDNVPPPGSVVTLEMDLQNLIMEGVRRIDERERLEEIFPDRELAVEMVSNIERVRQSVSFTPEEWQVFFLLDGRRTISEICRLVGNPDELPTLRVLHRLLAAKFVTLVRPTASAEEPAPLTSLQPAPTPSAIKAAAQQFSVEFQPRAKKIEDDTHEIITPKAVGYQQGAKTLTVSRLVLVKDGQETSFPLTKDSYTIGRSSNNDIVISNPKVSSFHARIDRTPAGFVLVDLKSRNGCWVNGKRIESQPLTTGDEIRLGPAKLTYKLDYKAPVT